MKNRELITKWHTESVPALMKERDSIKKKRTIDQLKVSFGTLKIVSDLRVYRKNIARIETILQEKLIAASKHSKETL